jgi:hypothetical protein
MFDNDLLQNFVRETETNNVSIAIRTAIWFLGNAAWIFGIIDRSIAIFVEGCLSLASITELLIALFLFVCWLFLKPNGKTTSRTPQDFDFRPSSLEEKGKKGFKLD